PWSGLKLTGITIAQGTTSGTGNFLEARNFGLRISFFSLFSRRLVIKEVSLVSPRVVWPQNADGKWRLPDLRPERREGAQNSAAVSETSPAEGPERTRTKTETSIATTPSKQPLPRSERITNVPTAFISEIHKVSLTDGNFRFLGRENESVANFEGVGFRA